jgi:hypothetical protein
MLTTLLGSGQGTAPATLDLTEVIDGLRPALGAYKYADLVFWDQAELYAFADEAVERLARRTGGFVERDASTAIVASTAAYNAPTRHLSTIHLSIDNKALKEAGVHEIEALNDDWMSAEDDDPDHYIEDFEGTEQVRIYPTPGSGASGNLGFIFHRYSDDIVVGAATLSAPKVVGDCIGFSVLAEARDKESKGRMPEVAEWARGMAGLLEEAMREYWGEAQ